MASFYTYLYIYIYNISITIYIYISFRSLHWKSFMHNASSFKYFYILLFMHHFFTSFISIFTLLNRFFNEFQNLLLLSIFILNNCLQTKIICNFSDHFSRFHIFPQSSITFESAQRSYPFASVHSLSPPNKNCHRQRTVLDWLPSHFIYKPLSTASQETRSLAQCNAECRQHKGVRERVSE